MMIEAAGNVCGVDVAILPAVTMQMVSDACQLTNWNLLRRAEQSTTAAGSVQLASMQAIKRGTSSTWAFVAPASSI